MSQKFISNGAASSAGEGSSRTSADECPNTCIPRHAPDYLVVGSGPVPESATSLMASLNNDSGYGGSIAGESQMGPADLSGWHAGLMEDRPTPSNTPVLPGELNEGLFSLTLALRDKKHADLNHS
jgi:mitofusin